MYENDLNCSLIIQDKHTHNIMNQLQTIISK